MPHVLDAPSSSHGWCCHLSLESVGASQSRVLRLRHASNAPRRFIPSCSALRHPAHWLNMASADFCLSIGRPLDRPSHLHRLACTTLRSARRVARLRRPGRFLRLTLDRTLRSVFLADRQISQGKARDLPSSSAAYTALGPDVVGLRIPTPPRPPSGCLVCGSCSSDRRFACSFLPTRPRGRAVAVRLGVPDIKASRGLAPPSHFPVRFRSPVDSARHGAARHAWRTSSSPGASLPRGPHRSGRAELPHPAPRVTGSPRERVRPLSVRVPLRWVHEPDVSSSFPRTGP